MPRKSPATPAPPPTVKKAAAKSAKPKRKRSLSPSHSGLKGPPVDLPAREMNADETAVTAAFIALGGGPVSLKQLASSAFPTLKPVPGNSKVRNALRRLVRGQWADQVGRGTYKLTKGGKLRARKGSFRRAA